MKSVLIGYPASGKTTLFDALSGAISNDAAKNNSNIRTIKVIDDRLAKLRDYFNPKKYSPAEILLVDNYVSSAEFSKNNSIFNRQTIDTILKSEVTVIVLRAFKNDNIPHFKNRVSALEDLKNIIEEMCFTDLVAAEKKIERLKKENKKNKEFEIMTKCYEQLQNNLPVAQLKLTDEDFACLSGFRFLTQNPILAVINIGAEDISENEYSEITNFCKNCDIAQIKLNAQIEFEISQIEDPNDKEIFLKEYNLTEPASIIFVKQLYSMMGLISFFTVGQDEVKAWTIRKGLTALKAAGKIHSDIERGFIRAEIMKSEIFFSYNGNQQKIKNDGKLQIEGKDYLVNDGDIINFRFNV